MPSFTFILVPGAGGSAWYWHSVVPMLKQRGHAGYSRRTAGGR